MQKREQSAAEASGKGACHHPKPTQGGSHAPGFRPQNTSGSPPAMVEKNSIPGNVKCYTDSCRGEVSVQHGGKRQ